MYKTQNAKEIESGLPADVVLDGVIVYINDGRLKDFVKDLTKWDADADQFCIKAFVEVKNKSGASVKVEQLFTYHNNEDGVVVYGSKSNLAKFKRKYGCLPDAGVKVKVQTNGEGFGKIKLD